jgi:hypothetical protein
VAWSSQLRVRHRCQTIRPSRAAPGAEEETEATATPSHRWQQGRTTIPWAVPAAWGGRRCGNRVHRIRGHINQQRNDRRRQRRRRRRRWDRQAEHQQHVWGQRRRWRGRRRRRGPDRCPPHHHQQRNDLRRPCRRQRDTRQRHHLYRRGEYDHLHQRDRRG